MIDRQLLLGIIQDELKIDNIYDAKVFQNIRYQYHDDWPVVSIKMNRGKRHYVVEVWLTAALYRKTNRPRADKTYHVNFYGAFIEAPGKGRPRKKERESLSPLYVSLYKWMMPLADKLPNLFYIQKPGKFYRLLLYGALCKHALRNEREDDFIYCRKLVAPNWDEAWMIFSGEDQPLLPKGHKSEWAAWRNAYHMLVMGETKPLLDS